MGKGRAPMPRGARPGSGGKKGGPNPTDRGTKGTQKSLVVDGDGGPLGVVIAGANVLERRRLRATIEAIVVERPEPTEERPENWSRDGGYQNATGRGAATEAKSIPQIQSGSEVVPPGARKPSDKPRRGVVERTFAGLSKCRGIVVRYDKKDSNSLGLIPLACALYWYRRMERVAQSDANQNPT
jgi:putative transposase